MAEAIVYGSEFCGFCKAAVNYLKKKGVSVEYRDVFNHLSEVKSTYKELCEKENICQTVVPLIKIKGKTIVGFNREQIDKIL